MGVGSGLGVSLGVGVLLGTGVAVSVGLGVIVALGCGLGVSLGSGALVSLAEGGSNSAAFPPGAQAASRSIKVKRIKSFLIRLRVDQASLVFLEPQQCIAE